MTDQDLLKNPRVKNLFNQLWEEKKSEMNKSGKEVKQKGYGKTGGSPQIKSPSDTTIYAPALNRNNKNKEELERVNDQVLLGSNNRTCESQMNKMVANFVDTVRLEHEMGIQEKERRCASMEVLVAEQSRNEAHKRADQAVIDTEKFKATIAKPGVYMVSHVNVDQDVYSHKEIGQEGFNVGQENQMVKQVGDPPIQTVNWVVQGQADHIDHIQNAQDSNMGMIPNIGSGVSDDDFFHLTCHIEPGLIHKIQKGEFVELEKLLPKDKFKTDENCLEWVQREGGDFLSFRSKRYEDW